MSKKKTLRKITVSGNLPRPGQTGPRTIIINQPQRFGLDISAYINAVRGAENVDFTRRTKLYDLYSEIIMDPHLSSVMDKRRSHILSTPISFMRDGEPDEVVNEQLSSPWFYDLLCDAWDTIAWGFSLLQFRMDGKWLNYDLVPRKHVDPVRRLILRHQTDISGQSWDEFDELLALGKPDALGLLAKAAPFVIYKRGTFADWAQFSEIFGMPIREYTYDSADEEARHKLINDASMQGANAVYIHPSDSFLKLIESGNKTGSSDLYEGLKDACNSEISKLFLGNTLTTEASNKGTQALGTVHKEVEDTIAKSDKRYILNFLNYDMSDIFSDFGIDISGGRFEFVDSRDVDTSKQAIIVTQMRQLNLPIGDDYLYRTFGIDKPENYEELKKKMETAAKAESTPITVPTPAAITNQAQKSKSGLLSFFVHKKKDNSQKIDDLYRKHKCKHYEIVNAGSSFKFDFDALEASIRRIYDKDINPEKEIDEGLFNAIYDVFSKATDEGFGSFEAGDPEFDFYNALKNNNAVFSCFRAHRMQNDIAEQLLDDKGKLKPFKQFSNDVQPIADHHVKDWLETEYNTAVIRAHQAADWQQFQREKDILPNLKWMPTTSPDEDPVHREFWSMELTLPVDHPFWEKHYPGDRWNCKCSLQATDEEASSNPASIKEKSDPGLDNNPGISAEIFTKSHPFIADAPSGTKKVVEKFLKKL